MNAIQKYLLSSISAICLLAMSLSTAHAADGWMTDYEAAKEKAEQTGKPLLLDFTGSDWCGWCIRLDREVFSKEAFKQYAKEALILVELDFPKRKKQSESVKKQNEALAKKYRVRGFPTIILLSPEGDMIGKTGYRPGGPESYVAHLKEMLGKG